MMWVGVVPCLNTTSGTVGGGGAAAGLPAAARPSGGWSLPMPSTVPACRACHNSDVVDLVKRWTPGPCDLE